VGDHGADLVVARKEREREGERRARYTLQSHALSDLRPPPGPTSNSPISYGFINGLMH
jgi:hypothetical protein